MIQEGEANRIGDELHKVDMFRSQKKIILGFAIILCLSISP
jgi:hypothetical protein